MSEFVVESGKSGAALTISDDGKQVFIRGTWKGRTSKSKKGHMNMAWFPKEMFDELIAKYQFREDEQTEREPGEEDF
jgi:hypothetical protein